MLRFVNCFIQIYDMIHGGAELLFTFRFTLTVIVFAAGKCTDLRIHTEIKLPVSTSPHGKKATVFVSFTK